MIGLTLKHTHMAGGSIMCYPIEDLFTAYKSFPYFYSYLYDDCTLVPLIPILKDTNIVPMIKMLKRREECDTYLTHICRQSLESAWSKYEI
jgi:hypothetical protein